MKVSVSTPSQISPSDPAEVVIGLIAPIGVNRDRVKACIHDAFKRTVFEVHEHKCSTKIREVSGEYRQSKTKFERIVWHMKQGNNLRKTTPDFVALLAAQSISQSRYPDDTLVSRPRVHIVDSLKHSEEVRRLREIYGTSFYCISLYSPRPQRIRWLQKIGLTETEATNLVIRDENEGKGHQQETSRAFQLGDVFIRVSEGGGEQKTLLRFLELIQMHPHHTPTKEEHGMYAAYSAAMKSGSLARQVGAAVTTPCGELVSTGCNDAPSTGGGQYWAGPNDQRDAQIGRDFNDDIKSRMIEGIVAALAPDISPHKRLKFGKKKLGNSGILDITEYGRDVHAEMAALLSAARRGVPTQGMRLFTTTYPCHNCAKHLVAAGIQEVFYVEPYPKSKARLLHGDAITLDGEKDPRKLQLKAFEGIGPRRYFDLFSMDLVPGAKKNRKNDSGEALPFTPGEYLRLPENFSRIVEKEGFAAKRLSEYLTE